MVRTSLDAVEDHGGIHHVVERVDEYLRVPM